MRAFVMKGIGKVGFADKPIPSPGPTDAVVKTTKALICTSDVHTVNGAIGPRENLTLGHEAVGLVHQVGSAVKTPECLPSGAPVRRSRSEAYSSPASWPSREPSG